MNPAFEEIKALTSIVVSFRGKRVPDTIIKAHFRDISGNYSVEFMS